jgi:rhamnogalacturonan endolyase
VGFAHHLVRAIGGHSPPYVFLLALTVTAPTFAQRQMEHLGRGVVAIHEGDGNVFVSWRLLGTDPDATTFNLYRQSAGREPVKLNEQPLAGPTHYRDGNVDFSQAVSYFVRPIMDGKEQAPSRSFKLPPNAPPQAYLSVPTQAPEGYHANDCSVGDLDGDGEYEIVVHMVGRGRDNSQGGITTEPIFHAYKLDGTLLWKINLGRNIREGAHYTQFLVYDFDGDGRAEFVCKTADGTLDGEGHTIGDPAADHRNPGAPAEAATPQRPRRGDRSGHIQKGPEFLTVFDGLTGAALATVDYLPPRGGDGSAWGDSNANRVERYLACVAYLDGQRPSIVMCRGYYTRAVLAAWDWRDGQLTSRWVFDTDDGTPGNRDYRGQGNHSVSVADVDGDGKDEIVYGSCVIDDDGKGLFSTKLGHGDALHVTDLDPARPGLEVWGIHENEQGDPNKVGTALYDAKTGEVLFTGSIGQDVGRGMAADIDPRHFGAEMWGGSGGLRNTKGERIGDAPRSVNFAIWWDGDLLREFLDGVNISKWDHESSRENRIFSGRELGLASNNGSKSNPCLSADILGDWREELIARTAGGKELRIYTTTIPTEHRFPTLMHDPHYRLSVAWQNVAYNQPPHTGFYLGVGMSSPPRPNIVTAPRR